MMHVAEAGANICRGLYWHSPEYWRDNQLATKLSAPVGSRDIQISTHPGAHQRGKCHWVTTAHPHIFLKLLMSRPGVSVSFCVLF